MNYSKVTSLNLTGGTLLLIKHFYNNTITIEKYLIELTDWVNVHEFTVLKFV